MRSLAFLLLATALLSPAAAGAQVRDDARLQLREPMSDDGSAGLARKVGFYALGTGASLGALVFGLGTVSAIGLEGTGASVTAIALVLGASALAHYGLGALLDVPVSLGSTLLGNAIGAVGAVGLMFLLARNVEPEPGFAGIATAAYVILLGMATFSLLSPLAVLLDPIGLAQAGGGGDLPPSRALADEPRANLGAVFTLPVVARAF